MQNAEIQRDVEFFPLPLTEEVSLTGLTEPAALTNADLQEEELWAEEALETRPPEGGDRPRRSRAPFDFEKCYRLAETGCSVREVAAVLSVPDYVVTNNIRAKYGTGWTEYAARATAALNGEVKGRLIDLIRKGNQKLLIAYAMKFLGWDSPKKVELSGPGGLPIRTAQAVMTMSNDDIRKELNALRGVIDQRSPFECLGQLGEGLTLEAQ